jgi:DNA-binding GntR family transcriptional regulator
MRRSARWTYAPEIEAKMKITYAHFSEKDRRIYAAIEAQKLPHGGITYIADLFGCSRKTIRQGMKELEDPRTLPKDRIRRAGGGRKPKLETIPGLDAAFLEVVRDYTAGDPMQEDVLWTNLAQQEIANQLRARGMDVSKQIVNQLLQKHHFKARKARKRLSTGTNPDRDAQFRRIAELRAAYEAAGNPIISIDTKQKELLGRLFREGRLSTQLPLDVYDHDFASLADGIAIPYTLYDVQRNHAFVCLGTSKDTAAFVCDAIHVWWTTEGRDHYPHATSMLVLADSGGSNSYRHHVFKEALQQLANRLGIELRMAHYPPYASKWNPVEHRVFPHITRVLRGVILTRHEQMKRWIERTKTATGLTVTAHIYWTIYQTGKKVSAAFKQAMPIVFDHDLGKWNYRAVPLQC